jgi:alcohol dehydrogenase class IV
MLLPVVTAWSAPEALSRYADCARHMGVAADENDEAAVAGLVQALRDLNRDLLVPTPKSYGIDKARWTSLLPLMAEQAIASGSPGNNPRVPDANTIQDLYREAWA